MERTSREVLLKKLEDAKKKIEVGGYYSHYKSPDMVYVVTGFGIDEDTEEVRVEYQRIDEDPPLPWRRVLNGENGFLTPVFVDGKKIDRFNKVD